MKYKDFFILTENITEYRGEHEAPDKTSGSPLFNPVGMYPEDIYSSDGLRLYGNNNGDQMDRESWSAIVGCKNRPNKLVKIYRAIPQIVSANDSRLKNLSHLIAYFSKWKFFPVGNDIVGEFEKNHGNEDYDTKQKSVLVDIENEIKKLSPTKVKYSMERGNWVSLSKSYAIDHGKLNLNNKYKILTKTVPAKHLYTDVNSINKSS